MEDLQYSIHAAQMMQERRIKDVWVLAVCQNPETEEMAEDGTIHYVARVPEADGRWLRVVVNPGVTPNRVVTLFFDRRLRRRS